LKNLKLTHSHQSLIMLSTIVIHDKCCRTKNVVTHNTHSHNRTIVNTCFQPLWFMTIDVELQILTHIIHTHTRVSSCFQLLWFMTIVVALKSLSHIIHTHTRVYLCFQPLWFVTIAVEIKSWSQIIHTHTLTPAMLSIIVFRGNCCRIEKFVTHNTTIIHTHTLTPELSHALNHCVSLQLL